MMFSKVFFINIHQLYYKIDPAAGRVGVTGAHNIFFPKNRDVIFYHKLASASAILNDRISYDEPLVRPQTDL
jgi:hypothetical protein